MDKKLQELYDKADENGKKRGIQFTKEELAYIKKHIKKTRFQIIYCWWKNPNSKKPLGYVIDATKDAPRRSPFFNSVDIIKTRDLTDREFKELVLEQFGTQHRRFTCYWYNSVLGLMEDDKELDVETPSSVIAFAKEKGMVRGLQTSLDF